MPQLIEVALPVPLRTTFSYRYTLPLTPALGARVRVPFGHRQLVGIIVALDTASALADDKLKNVIELLDEHPLIPTELMALCQWGASYYHHPLGEALSTALPQRFREGKAIERSLAYTLTREGKGLPESALKRAKKQQAALSFLQKHTYLREESIASEALSKTALNSLIEKGLVEKTIAPEDDTDNHTPQSVSSLIKEEPLPLNQEQQHAFDSLRYHQYNTYLLFGVTGSGKTEVYMQAITRVLQSGRQALVLIPEIGLSPQTIGRFRRRFHVNIAELHSNVAKGERAKHWLAAKSGQARIVIGTRLASLTPFADLGIIIIDEEHDKSYKQQDGFKYSARDISVYRAHKLGIPIILGSATPSLESLHNVNLGKYIQLTLSRRPGSAQAPTMSTVDLRNQRTHAGLSDIALERIGEVLTRNEQVLVFLNRRGYAPALICHSCGWSAECSACDTRMTLHQQPPHLLCHHCERRRPIPKRCDQCGGTEIQTSGYGTEQVEQALKKHFPTTPVIRIDKDSTRRKNGLENQLAKTTADNASILVGTQMLAKGHHLPNLTLVVILEADHGLMSPDYRALENMGQVITQVAGRAGREDKRGEVLVQTHAPTHPLTSILLEGKYNQFAEHLLSSRKKAQLPPYCFTSIFITENRQAKTCLRFLEALKAELCVALHTSISGPFPASVEKVDNYYRYYLRISSNKRTAFHHALTLAVNKISELKPNIRWSLEVDPNTLQ